MTEKQDEYKIPESAEVIEGRVNKIVQSEVVSPLPAVQGPMEIIAQAVQRGAGEKELEILERMFEFDLRVKAQQSVEAFNDAMAQWKANAPHILKDKEVSYSAGKGKTAYSHATLGNVADTINTSMSPFGLHASWKTDQPENKIKVTCTVSHKLGHSESTSLQADADTSGSKNAIQAMGSTITYLERYTLLALTGLATHDQDNDGESPDKKPIFINEVQQKEITKKIKSIYGDDPSIFFSWLGFETVDTIPEDQFKRAMDGLKKAETKKAAMEKDAKRMREPGDDDE